MLIAVAQCSLILQIPILADDIAVEELGKYIVKSVAPSVLRHLGVRVIPGLIDSGVAAVVTSRYVEFVLLQPEICWYYMLKSQFVLIDGGLAADLTGYCIGSPHERPTGSARRMAALVLEIDPATRHPRAMSHALARAFLEPA